VISCGYNAGWGLKCVERVESHYEVLPHMSVVVPTQVNCMNKWGILRMRLQGLWLPLQGIMIRLFLVVILLERASVMANQRPSRSNLSKRLKKTQEQFQEQTRCAGVELHQSSLEGQEQEGWEEQIGIQEGNQEVNQKQEVHQGQEVYQEQEVHQVYQEHL
jgi:hypothetical protein